MRIKIFIGIFVLLTSFCVLATDECGDSREDRRYSYLDWVKTTDYKVVSSFIRLHGTLCVGIDRVKNQIARVHYRDDSGVVVTTNKERLKRNDVTFLRHADFPLMARLATRDVDPLTIKITSEKVTSEYTEYKMSLKFARNMTKGFSPTDIRELIVRSRFYKSGEHEVFYGNTPTSSSVFDLVSLKIDSSLMVGKISFYDGQSIVQTLNTAKLKQVKR